MGEKEGSEILTTFSFSSSSLMVSFFCGFGFSSFAGLMVIWGCGQVHTQLHQIPVPLHSLPVICFYLLLENMTAPPAHLNDRKWLGPTQLLLIFVWKEQKYKKRVQWGDFDPSLVSRTSSKEVCFKMGPVYQTHPSCTSKTLGQFESFVQCSFLRCQIMLPFKDHIYKTAVISHSTIKTVFYH